MKSAGNQLSALSDHRCELGEGLYIHRDILAWLDIASDSIYISERQIVRRFCLPVKATVILDCIDGRLVLGSARGLGTVEVTTGIYQPLYNEQRDFCGEAYRTNDGCSLVNGSFLLGTMHKKSPREVSGKVLVVDNGVARQVVGNIAIPNLFVETEDDVVLIADSLQGTIYQGRLDRESMQLTLTQWYQAELGVSPDGGCLLPDGRIAVAMWDGACVRVFEPAGTLACELPVPALRPTNVKYDPANHMLWITSAREGLGGTERARYPMSGMTFSIPYPEMQ